VEVLGQLAAEIYRLLLLRGLDDRLRDWGFGRLAGVDEAGRGCLAGPVVAAAVIADPARPLPGVDDSKSLQATKRRRLAGNIRETAVSWSVAAVSSADIDRVNILEATRIAMIRALEGLGETPDCAVIDAVRLPPRPYPCLGLVRGDVVSYSVACASILAKEERDRMMVEIDARYPHYGFARHKGYAVSEHYRALSRFGPSPEHRLTFRSVLPHVQEASH
jgi:ribonuclease HII